MTLKININMRCIEIPVLFCVMLSRSWLTLTWDVLKWKNDVKSGVAASRLTLTWDVLK